MSDFNTFTGKTVDDAIGEACRFFAIERDRLEVEIISGGSTGIFGLYQALLHSIELRHASFITHLPFTNLIWLADLSAKDPFYITPLIMGATMFLQQKMTPAPGDPTQAKVMLFMPVIFTFMFLNFPSGLVIYWLVNNVISIAQQGWMLNKKS